MLSANAAHRVFEYDAGNSTGLVLAAIAKVGFSVVQKVIKHFRSRSVSDRGE